MSADFEKVLVKDPRLDVEDSIKYAVIKGGQNVTMAQYQAISATNYQMVFNVQVPSEQTIIDRRVLLNTTLNLQVAYTKTGDSGEQIYYGNYSALASFPLHQLMTVLSVTINNNTVSINMRDVLPIITRLLCEDDLVYYNGSTPTFSDTMASYCPQLVGIGLNNPNSSYWGVNDRDSVHRGCFAPVSYSAADGKANFSWNLTEPLLISPFIFSNLKANGQGFYGIQNLNVVINIGDTSRVFRGMNSAGGTPASFSNPSPAKVAEGSINYITSVAGLGGGQGDLFTKPQLLFNFLTPHPSDLMPARNIVPFYELPRYITSSAVSTGGTPTTGSGLNVAKGGDFQVSSNSLQLNQIPDKLIVYIRATASKQSFGSPDVAFPIKKITVNFNNNSGILASATQVDLWQMSRNNGLCTSWNDWTGLVTTTTYANAGGTTPSIPPVYNQAFQNSPAVGSYLVLEFGKDIQLTEDFYAAGSLGNFNLQVIVDSYNNLPYSINSSDDNTAKVDLVLITMNSGVFVCERGTSSTYTGILTKQDVLEASQQEHYTHEDVKRMVGSGFWDSIKSGATALLSKGKDMAVKAAKKHGKKLLKHGMKHGAEMLGKYLE